VGLLIRAAGAASRRLGRPELLALVDPAARQAQRDAIGINAVLASSLHGDGGYIDVGANRGQVLREALRVDPAGRHVAFEPIPSLAEGLALSFPTVDVRQRALAAEPGVAEFCHFRRLDGWSGLRRRPDISDARADPEYITVEVSTLDAELAGLAPSVLKIDVEGAEVAVLEGGRALLSRARPTVIFEHDAGAAALYGATSGGAWDLLSELDYEIFSAAGDGPFTRSDFANAEGIVNWLATPRARTARNP
jgi:FkbM family methyltransferase